MQDPKWIGTSPSAIAWTADGKNIQFRWNPERKTSDSAYAYNTATKSIEQICFNTAELNYAIQQGTYNIDHTKILYNYKGDVYLLDLPGNKTIRITKTTDFETVVGFSNQENWVIYQRGNNLFAWNTTDGSTQQLTNIIAGEAPQPKSPNIQEKWLADYQLITSDILKQRKRKQEERWAFLQAGKTDTLRNIYIGDKELASIQISSGARYISYIINEAATGNREATVPSYVTASGFAEELPSRTNVGEQQGKQTLFLYDRLKDTVFSIKTDSLPGITDLPEYYRYYPAKYDSVKPTVRAVNINAVHWSETGSNCVVSITSQDNKDLWLAQLDTENGRLTVLDRQHDDAWIDGPGIGTTFGWLNNHSIYYQSEATGYSHLYSYDISTKTKRAITQGAWEVQQVVLSHNKQYFYMVTNETQPGEQHFYRLNVDGSKKEKITTLKGAYEIEISPDEKQIAYRYSYQNKPWELYLQENNAGKKPLQLTDKAQSPEWRQYPWRDTRIFSFKARDSVPVYARIYEPKAGTGNKAAVIFVHGAGYLQNVTYGWSYYYHEMMFNNLLADLGYTVLDIDYRASAGYGRNFRTGIYRFMGGKDLDDQVDAARLLVSQYGIDPARIGMYGGSYGGFITLMAMFTTPGVIKAGAALRPVTDWSHYNHGYTSNILNEPFTDSISFARSSPINFAAGLQGALLICHGMVDVNVHYQDAVRLAQRLIELGKNNWELASYPVEDHGFVEPSSWTDEYKRILKLFNDNLLVR